jgi:hypothetical protein
MKIYEMGIGHEEIESLMDECSIYSPKIKEEYLLLP